MDHNHTFRASRIKGSIVGASLGMLLVTPVFLLTGELNLPWSLFLVIGSPLHYFLMGASYDITVGGGRITGRSGAALAMYHISIEVRGVDVSRTGTRTFLDRLLGHHVIWARDGRRIVLDSWLHDPKAVQAVLQYARSGDDLVVLKADT